MDDANAGIQELIQSDLIKLVFPNISINKKKVDMVNRANNSMLRKISVFYDVRDFHRIMSELKFTNEEVKSVSEAVKFMNFFDSNEEDHKILEFRRLAGNRANLILDFIDLLNKPVNIDLIKTRLEQMKNIPTKSPIGGNDLIGLGIKPGPFRKLLDMAQQEFEKNPNISKEELLNKIQQFM